MRQKRQNHYFTFLYPGYFPGGATPADDAPHVAIPFDGEFVSITGIRYGGEQSSAVFLNPQDLRDLAHVLEEAADIFEENRAASHMVICKGCGKSFSLKSGHACVGVQLKKAGE